MRRNVCFAVNGRYLLARMQQRRRAEPKSGSNSFAEESIEALTVAAVPDADVTATSRSHYRSGRIPLLMKEGWPATRKKDPFRNGAPGGRSKLRCGMRFETWCVATTPSALFKWLRSILLMAQPPLLQKEGKYARRIEAFVLPDEKTDHV